MHIRRRYAFLAQKIAGAQYGDCRFFAALGDHADPDPALLDVKDCCGYFTLGENRLPFPQFDNGPARAGFGQKLHRRKTSI
jgi:hypothetical protein